MADLNHITLTGTLDQILFTRRSEAGLSWLSFSLKVRESRQSGATFTLFVPVECYGAGVDQAQDLSAGDALLVAGKLEWSAYTAKRSERTSRRAVLVRMVRILEPTGVPV